MNEYIIYENTDTGTNEVARVDQYNHVTGKKAKIIEKLLLEQGFPEIPPDRILHGQRLVAVKQS